MKVEELFEYARKPIDIIKLTKIVSDFRDSEEITWEWNNDKQIFKNNCYSQSFTLAQILKKNHINCNLIRGYYILNDGDYEGHSWLTVGDKIVDITADQFYPNKEDDKRIIITDKNNPHYSKKQPNRWSMHFDDSDNPIYD
jgi:hypothetical protein